MKHRKPYHRLFLTLALIAMSMSFMAQITPLWAKATDGQSMVICTAFGIETITIDKDGNRVRTRLPADSDNLRKHCTMCLASTTSAILPQNAAYLRNSPIRAKTARVTHTYSVPSQDEFAHTHGIRAPPPKS